MKRKMSLAFVAGLLVAMVFTSCSKLREDFDFDTVGNYSVWKERVTPIVEGCTTDYEKALAIYLWECDNIEYDFEFKIYHAESCWEHRKGVCQAYSELFMCLANGCDLVASVITGYVKGPDDDHAWVKVKTEKGWILADPTWGDGDNYSKAAWFDVAPEWAIFNRFPDYRSNQMLSTPITRSQFKDLPDISWPIGSKFWWNNRGFLDYYLNHNEETVPEFNRYSTQVIDNVKLIEAPYQGKLKVGETYTFKVQCLDTCVVIGNYSNIPTWMDTFEAWEKEGDVYTKVFRPDIDWVHPDLGEGAFGIVVREKNKEDIMFVRYFIVN